MTLFLLSMIVICVFASFIFGFSGVFLCKEETAVKKMMWACIGAIAAGCICIILLFVTNGISLRFD